MFPKLVSKNFLKREKVAMVSQLFGIIKPRNPESFKNRSTLSVKRENVFN